MGIYDFEREEAYRRHGDDFFKREIDKWINKMREERIDKKFWELVKNFYHSDPSERFKENGYLDLLELKEGSRVFFKTRDSEIYEFYVEEAIIPKKKERLRGTMRGKFFESNPHLFRNPKQNVFVEILGSIKEGKFTSHLIERDGDLQIAIPHSELTEEGIKKISFQDQSPPRHIFQVIHQIEEVIIIPPEGEISPRSIIKEENKHD